MERAESLNDKGANMYPMQHIADSCNGCGSCVRPCAFLSRHGNPADIAREALYRGEYALAFECSLCGLCDAMCPLDLSISEMFLHMRRLEVGLNPALLKRFKGLRSYVKTGRSRWLKSYVLPQGCTQVFFPGCALPGTRADLTWDVYTYLAQHIPNLGLVLDCCSKPFNDIGMQGEFSTNVTGLARELQQNGIVRVITACPNCYEVFNRYTPQLQVRSVYEVLEADIPVGEMKRADKDPATGPLQVTVHDPCVNRTRPSIQTSVRRLIEHAGMDVCEMENSRETTLCCGEGGCVMATAPDLAQSWRSARVQQAHGLPVVTYCAGCVEYLSTAMPTLHVLDMVVSAPDKIAEPVAPARGLKRYLDRFNLKRKAEKYMQNRTDVSAEVKNPPQAKKKGSVWGRLALLTVLVAAIAALKLSGAGSYLQPERMQDWIAGYGYWAPLIYIVLYSLAPALFMPGLPLTILGGLLFGPVWGVVYTITGATSGACVAFLIARYLGRNWVSSKITGARWQKLDADVARHGWKIVALTRLIPLFPFNLLNYAFGVTRVSFFHYALTSFICMLPATIAYVSLSSSVGQLLKGELSVEFGIGIGLVVLLSLLPLVWRRYTRGKKLRIDE